MIWPKIAVSVALLGFFGVVHGLWTERWQPVPEAADAASRLEAIPQDIASWHGQDLKLDAEELAGAGYSGALWRNYANPKGGKPVSMLVVCGRPGRVSVHTPEACFRGEGFDLTGTPAHTEFSVPPSEQPADFWRARFIKTSRSAPQQLRIYWSWNAGSGWQAADNPRLAFSRFSVLYKLYLVSEIDPGDPEQDAAAELMPQLLPELHKALFEE